MHHAHKLLFAIHDKMFCYLFLSPPASCMAALDSCTSQLSLTAAALRQALETEHDAEQEVNPLLYSTVICLIVIPCFPSQTCSSCCSRAVFLASQRADTGRCVVLPLDLHHAPVLRLTAEQAQAGARAAADAVVVCSSPLACCISFLTWLKATVTASHARRPR